MCDVIKPAVIAAQIEAESGWNPNARSPVGAEGLSQFMPGTWPSWGEDDDGNGRASPYDPGDAIMAQGRYDCALAKTVEGYKNRGEASGETLDLALAAYNAGPGAVHQYHGMPPYTETRVYVARIKSLISKYESVDDPPGTIPAGQELAMPLSGRPRVTSPFGMRMHPIKHVYKLHTGIDFAAPLGTTFKAARGGTVTFMRLVQRLRQPGGHLARDHQRRPHLDDLQPHEDPERAQPASTCRSARRWARWAPPVSRQGRTRTSRSSRTARTWIRHPGWD